MKGTEIFKREKSKFEDKIRNACVNMPNRECDNCNDYNFCTETKDYTGMNFCDNTADEIINELSQED